MMKKIGIIVFTVFLITLIILFYRSSKLSKDRFKSEYRGKIEDIIIGDKGYHSAILNDTKTVRLSEFRSCIKDLIRPGDSIYKAPNTWKLYIYRQKRYGYELIKICDHQ